MKIKKITVNGLFNTFNYEIPMNDEERITIIHGPNGYGKTTILELIYSLFKAQYWKFHMVPFNQFEIEFFNGENIQIIKSSDKVNEQGVIKSTLNFLHFIPKDKGELRLRTTIVSDNYDLEKLLIRYYRERSTYFEYIEPNKWYDNLQGDFIDTSTLVDRYRDNLPEVVLRIIRRKIEKLEKLLRHTKHIRFIESQRLFSRDFYKIIRLKRPQMVKKFFSTVTRYSKDLSERIKGYLTKYASISQSLDRTFPIRLIEFPQNNSERKILNEDEISTQLIALEEERSRLLSVGLLDMVEPLKFPKIEVQEYNRLVLTIYLDDIKKKLEVFEDIAIKLELFNNLINNRFTYKKMRIEKDKGFIFRSPDFEFIEGVNIEPTKLSSGEQHQIVLFYKLLFKTEENSLILIDEPEISLHIGWQKMFLNDLYEIAKMVKLNILIATHSPQIINEMWDLTVELKGPRV